MWKKDVLRIYKTDSEIARALGISVSAVCQWGPLVPPFRAHALAKLQPDLEFDPSLYRHSDARTQQIAELLSASS